jgi:hypothetical protein
MKLMRTLILILLTATTGMAADIFTVPVTEFQIPTDDDEPDSEVAITPTITLILTGDLPKNDKAPSIRAMLTGVSIGTVARPEYNGAFTFDSFPAEGAKGQVRELKVTINRAKLPDPLTYIAKVLLIRDGDPSVTPQALDLKFTRAAATVTAAPLRLENTRYFPLLQSGKLSPNSMKVLETSGRATLTNVQIQIKDYLTGADGFAAPAQLNTQTIDRIKAGTDGSTSLVLAGHVPLGSTKGTLVVRARQLAQPAEVSIEIVTHTLRFWLFLTIVLSIIAGYFFRTAPDKRLAEDQSRLAAEQQFGQINQLLGNAVDPDIRSQLQTILDTLRTAIDAKPFVATTLAAAVKKAADDTDVVMKAAESTRATLRTRIADLRGKLDSPDGQPPIIAQAVSGLIARLEAQDRALKSGAVTSVQAELDQINHELTEGLIPDAITQWAQQTHTALDQMGQWQALEFEADRKSVFDDTASANIPSMDLAKTRLLARKLRILVIGAGLLQIISFSPQLLNQLNALNVTGLKPKLDDARAALNELQALETATLAQLPDFANLVGKLGTALRDAVETAAKLSNVADPDGLDTGDFEKAVTGLSNSLRPVQQSLSQGLTAPSATPSIEVTNTSSFVAAASAAQARASTFWDLQLEAPVNPAAGEQAVANVTVIGTSPGAIDMEWTIGNSIQPGSAGPFSFVPPQPGALAISVRGVARATGESHTASAIIQVRPQHGFPAVNQILDQQSKDELRQTIASGFFILAAGYAIFQGAWTGTFLNFLAAALWGFSVDIGAAKVRELASPLLGKPLPT